MYKTVCRVETVTRAEVGRFTYHNIRKPNDHRTEGMEHIRREDMHKNEILFGSDQPTRDVKERIEGVKMARAAKGGEGNDIVAQELILSAHSEFFESMPEERIQSWQKANMAFLEERFPGNLVSVVVHRDERAPHIHAIVVPIVESKRVKGEKVLNATEYLGDRGTVLRALRAQGKAHESTLGKLQTEYTQAMQRAGFELERGAENSEDKHQSRDIFRKVEAGLEQSKSQVAELERRGADLAASVEKLQDIEAQKVSDVSKAGAQQLAAQASYEKAMAAWQANIKKFEMQSAALAEKIKELKLIEMKYQATKDSFEKAEVAWQGRIAELEKRASMLELDMRDKAAQVSNDCKHKIAMAEKEVAEINAAAKELDSQLSVRREDLAALDREEGTKNKNIEALKQTENNLQMRCASLNPPNAMIHIARALEIVGGMDKQTSKRETCAYVYSLEREEALRLCSQIKSGPALMEGYDKNKAEQERQELQSRQPLFNAYEDPFPKKQQAQQQTLARTKTIIPKRTVEVEHER